MFRLRQIAARVADTKNSNWLLFFVFIAITVVVSVFHAFSQYTSQFDEHTHLSYVQYAYEWVVPANGYPMNTWAKEAFSCHPHQLYGAMTPVPCGTIDIGKLYPTGGTNTSQTWPPVYFFLTALLMRITFIFQSDPLIAARIATSFLWAVGVSWLGVQLFRRSNRLILSTLFVLLMVSLPSFEYYSSFVSPHSMNPMIIATGLYLSDKYLLFHSKSEKNTENRKYFNIWIAIFVIFSAVAAFTIPQSVGIVGVFIVYILISRLAKSEKNFTSLLRNLTYPALVGITSLFLMSKIVAFWSWQVGARAKPFPPGVSQSDVVLDSGDAVYKNIVVQIIDRWWSFWPGSLHSGIPAGPYAAGIETLWVLIIPSLSIAAIIFWKRNNYLSYLMLSVFIVAPLISIYFDMALGAGIPGRYGIGIAIIGCFSIANKEISKWPAYALLALGVATYLSAFFLDPILVDAGTCTITQVSKILTCIK